MSLCIIGLYVLSVGASGFTLLIEALFTSGPSVFYLHLVPKSSQRSYERWVLYKAHRDPLLHCPGRAGPVSALHRTQLCGEVSLRNLTGRWLQRRLIYFPLAHLSHKSGLLRKHQFLFPVLLLSSVKPPKAPPGHCWLMMPLSPPLPLVLLLVSDQNVPHSHSKLDFPVFYLQNSPEFVSPSQMLPRTNVEKKLPQSSLTRSCFLGLEYGFSKSLDFSPSAPLSLIPPHILQRSRTPGQKVIRSSYWHCLILPSLHHNRHGHSSATVTLFWTEAEGGYF